MTKILINLSKVFLAAGLIGYLAHTGRLDFKQLSNLVEKPSLAFLVLSFWIIGPCALGSLRWKLLLKAHKYEISWPQALKLQLTGFFFNTAMPGAVGGDLVKVMYVIRDNKHLGKTPAIMSIFIDRLLGMLGLFVVGLIAAIFNMKLLSSNSNLLIINGSILLLTIGILLFFIASLFHYKDDQDPWDRLFRKNIPGFSILSKIYQNLRAYRFHRDTILSCFLLSLLIQFFGLVTFYSITGAVISGTEPSFSSIAGIFPAGMLTIALPISPGGLGVGHFAFEKLFSMIDLSQGANIFNIFLLSQLSLNLLGAIPYLGLKKNGDQENKCCTKEHNAM